MPYVEGFGTYPFGEEWLFDAVTRSHLPVLEIADRVTLSVTPVLADQLEADGVGERMVEFTREHRVAAAERDAANPDPATAAAGQSELDRSQRSLARLEQLGGDVVSAFREAQDAGRVELIASAATHALLPKLATTEARRLQIDAGLRSHRRRFGPSAGFWLPECGYEPGIDRLLAERAISHTCVDQSAVEERLAALAPVRTPAGPVAFSIDWPSVELVWTWSGYPSNAAYLQFHGLSENGLRLWRIDGTPYVRDEAVAQARADAASFLAAVAERLERFAAERGRRGLVTFAVDTELLGHWWSEGPVWLEAVLSGASGHGIEAVTLAEALGRHEPERRPLSASSWGEGKDMRTWDSARVGDLATAARRLELRLLRELSAGGLDERRAERATRELLAVQASDWAFLDGRGEAGDYPFERALDHAQALHEALDSAEPPDPRMRNLAPDLSLAPLLEP